MKTPKHTPGPWRTFQDVIIGTVSPAYTICSFASRLKGGDYDPKTFPDMDLIAAAPDLLAALEETLLHYVTLANSGDCGHWNPETEDHVKQARAALARAKGEQP